MGTDFPTLDRSETLSSRAAGLIREAISHGTIAGGETLRLDDLARRFGISRIPLRDALRQLEKEGFVAVTPFRGAKVLPLSVEEAREMSEMSLLLHTAALKWAFDGQTPEQLDKAEALLRARTAAKESAEWRRLSFEFLDVFYGPANRPFLKSMIAYVTDQSHRYYHVILPAMEKHGRPPVTFADVVAACRRRDLPAALAAIEESHKHLYDVLEKALQDRQNSAA
ncbi:MAG: GntR family transcriptional regulator [Gemmataceae bacterium]|nr:GntR family transcriptional regulator [Gemmataceae bacterium]